MSGSSQQRRRAFATRSFPPALVAAHGSGDTTTGLPGACTWRYSAPVGLHRFASMLCQGLNGPRPPPLARMAMASHVGGLDALALDTTAPAASSGSTTTRGRPNQWYQERCVTCHRCHAPINATVAKRGKQCVGCRRWTHRHCLPDAADAATSSAEAAAGAAAGACEAARPLFYHTAECGEAHEALREVAAQGPCALVARKAGPKDTWRLLDFSAVKPAYRAAQRLGGGAIAARRGAAGAAPGDAPSAGAGGGAVGAARPLDGFLDMLGLLDQVVAEPVGEVLEDSFGVLVRRGDEPVAAATLNLYGTDHVRLQSLVTAGAARRRGHARALVQQLQDKLRAAGVKQLVALIEPGFGDPAAAQRLFFSQGYVPASPEQRMAWRRELPEYHRNLVGGCQLLVKDLRLPAKRRWGLF